MKILKNRALARDAPDKLTGERRGLSVRPPQLVGQGAAVF
jgi:hypothetical protein